MRRRLAILPETPAEVVQQVYERADMRLAARRCGTEAAYGPVPCAAGCSNCCYRPTEVVDAEVPALVEGVRRLPVEQQREIEIRTRHWRRSMRAAGVDTRRPDESGCYAGYVQTGFACPLLDPRSQLCLVYDHRPLACRGEMIVDRGGRGGADCRDPDARPRHVDVSDIVADAWAHLVGGDTVLMLLPDMLHAAWPLVSGATTFERWRSELARCEQRVRDRPMVQGQLTLASVLR